MLPGLCWAVALAGLRVPHCSPLDARGAGGGVRTDAPGGEEGILVMKLSGLLPARWLVIVLKTWKALVRLNLTSTLTLMMNFHLHLCAECLMLPMRPLGHHQHDLYHGHALDPGTAVVCGDKAGPSASVYIDMVRHNLYDPTVVGEYCPQI